MNTDSNNKQDFDKIANNTNNEQLKQDIKQKQSYINNPLKTVKK